MHVLKCVATKRLDIIVGVDVQPYPKSYHNVEVLESVYVCDSGGVRAYLPYPLPGVVLVRLFSKMLATIKARRVLPPKLCVRTLVMEEYIIQYKI